MAVAQGIGTTVKRVKQSALGTAGTSGSKLMRRVSFDPDKESESYTSEELASHQMSTGATEGPSMINGALDGELSAGTYDLEFAALLRKDFAAPFTAITGASLTIAGSGPTYTVTRAAGDFLTGGVKKGYVVRLTVGSLNAANLNKNLLVVGVTATVLTVVPLNAVALVAEGPIATCTVSAPGKETHTPTTGHTNDYFTWEKWNAAVSASEKFVDVKPASASVSIPATGIAKVNFPLQGLTRVLGGSEVLTSPTAESTSLVLGAVQGKVVVNGTVTSVTNVQFQINGNTTGGAPEVGSNSRSDLQRGKVGVSGSFSAKFSGTTIMALRDAQTVVTLIFVLADSASATAEFVAFTIPAAKIFTDKANDGDAEIIRSYDFVGQYYGAGGAALESHATICQIHDSLAA